MTAKDSLLSIQGVTKRYGAVTAVNSISIDISHGEFFALLGPSGCGKTTLLRMIGGFARPSEGRIMIDGQDVTPLGPERRPVNTVFQGYGLFPHMSVRQNIGYGLKLAKTPADELAKRVEDTVALVRLGEFVNRAISELSGGQQQRVALARALIMRPKILLLDEPLSALDLKLRQRMQRELRRIHDEIGGTFIVVTHDQGEALSLADHIAVMRAGHIEQMGTPKDIYLRPESLFVSTFIGEANLIPGVRRSGMITLATGQSFDDAGPDEDIICMVRPENLSVIRAKNAERALEATLVNETYLGASVTLEFEAYGGQMLAVVEANAADGPEREIGQSYFLGWSKADQRILKRDPVA